MINWITENNSEGKKVVFYKYNTQYGPDTGIEYFATRNVDGTFNIATHDGEYKNVPFWGDFDNYRDMDSYAAGVDWAKTKAYVCHVDHNEANAYVLMLPTGSVYIRI